MAAHITLSYSTTSNGATSATVKVTMKYYGNGVSYSNVARTCKITLNGTTKSFTHTFSTSTSAQTMGSASFTITKSHSSKSLTASGSLDATNTSLGKLTDTVSVSVSAQTSYSVGYNANGGSGAPSAQTKWYGETLTLSSTKPTRTGYTFSKWNTASGGTGTNYASGGSYTANAAATLYAQWTTNTCVLTYNPNGGTVSPSTATKTYGATYGTLPTPSRTGYTFAGWYTAASGGSAVSSSTTITANTTIYAHWTELTANLTYDANGHGTAPSAVTMRYSTATTAASISATGYIFDGWNTKADGTGTTYQVGSTVKAANVVPSALTLYAQWTQEYKAPTISNVVVDRGSWNGTAFSSNLSGEFIRLSFNWTAGNDVSGINNTSFNVTIKNEGGTEQSIDLPYTTMTATESGEISCIPVEINSVPVTVPVGEEPEIVITVTDTTSDPNVSTTKATNLIKGGYVVHISPNENAVTFFGVDDGNGDGVIINKPLKIQNTQGKPVRIENGVPNSDTYFTAKRTDTGTEVGLGVGSGGVNHGVISWKLGDWMVFSNGDYTYVNKGALGRQAQIGSGSSSSNHGVALKNYFDANKSKIRRNDLIAFYDTTSGNGSVDFGYFLNGFDSNPYGGFFSAHYNTPYYIGIYNGTYTQNKLLTVSSGAQDLITITTASVTFSSIASGANSNTTKALSLSGWYPVGVVGWYATGTNQSNVGLYRCYLSGRSLSGTTGSATLNVYVSNHGASAMTPTIYAEILWIRAS